MPVWVKGNQCFMITTTAYDVGDPFFDHFIPNTLVNQNPKGKTTLIWQPGVIRGFNMYVGENTSDKDVEIRLIHGKWDGGSLHPETTTVLFTIPAGVSGDFCMKPSLIAESIRTFAARDEIRFQIEFVGGTATGDCRYLTWGVCYEITEEMMLDNDWPPNL